MNLRSIAALSVLALASVGLSWVFREFRKPAPTVGQPAANVREHTPAPAIAATPPAHASPAGIVEEISARLLKTASEHRDPVAREAFLQKAVRSVPRALYARLAEKLSSAQPRSVEAELLRAVVLRWAWEEPINASEWAVEQPDGPYRREALALGAQAWARLDPAQLLQWAAELAPADRQWVLLRSGDYLGRTDPALFAVWQQAIQPGRERDQLQLAITREWAQRDPERLVAALNENTGPEFDGWRQLTIAGLTTRLSSMNGPDAARFAMERVPAGPAQQQAVKGAVVAWAREDPAAARQWIDRFPGEDLRAEASQILLGYWLQRDAVAAQSYAQSLPAGSLADGASERVAQFLADKNGRDAVVWAERIADPSRRQQTLAFVLAEWSRRQPEEFQQLLRQRPELSHATAGSEG